MPQVPYQPYPTVEPREQGPEGFRVDTPGAAFGENIGHALAGLGKEVSHVGDELFNRAMALQQVRNETEANDAFNRYITKAAPIHEQFQLLEGENSARALPKYGQDLNALKDQIRGELSNDNVRRKFDNESRSFVSRSLFSGAAHAGDQQKRAYEASLAAKQSTIAGQVYNNGITDEDLTNYRRASLDIAASKGVSAKTAAEWAERDKSTLLSHYLAGVAQREPNKAQGEYDRLASQLKPEDAQRVKNTIDGKMISVDSRNIAFKVTEDAFENAEQGKPKMTEIQAIDKARELAKKNSNDPLYIDAVEKATASRYRMVAGAINEQAQRNVYTLRSGVAGEANSDFLPTNEDELQKLGPEYQAAWEGITEQQRNTLRTALAKNAKGIVPTSPQRRDNEHLLWSLATSPDSGDRERFAGLNLSEYDLSTPGLQALQKLQAKGYAKSRDDPNVNRAMRILSDAMLIPQTLNPKDNFDDYHRFRGFLGRMVEDHMQQYQKPPNPEEVKAMGREVLAEMPKTGWFGSNISNVQRYQQAAPTDFVEGMKNANPAITDEEIERQWIIEKADEAYTKLHGKKAAQKEMPLPATKKGKPGGPKLEFGPETSTVTPGPQPIESK